MADIDNHILDQVQDSPQNGKVKLTGNFESNDPKPKPVKLVGDFESNHELKKKESGLSLSNFQSRSPYLLEPEKTTLTDNEVYEFAKERKNLVSQTTVKPDYLAGNIQELPEYEKKQKRISEIDDKLKSAGYDPNEVTSDFGDLPHIDNFGVKDALQLKKDNPEFFQRKKAAIKSQSELFEAVKSKDGELAAKKFISDYVGGQTSFDYDTQREKTRQAVSDVYHYVDDGDKQKEIISNIVKDRMYGYGVELPGQLESIGNNKDYKNLNFDQSVALDFLQDTEPATYESYKNLISTFTPQELDGLGSGIIREKNKSFAVGYQLKAKELEDIGLNMRQRALEEKMNNYVTKSKENPLSPDDKKKYDELFDQRKTILDTREEQKNRYPLATALSADKLMQDYLGPKRGVVTKTILRMGANVDDIIDYAANAVPFLQAKEGRIHDLENFGDKQLEGALTYTTPSEELFGRDYMPVFSGELKSEIDAIKNSSGLSDEHKEDMVREAIIQNNYKDISYVPNDKSGKFNFTSKAVLNSISSLVGEIAPQVAISYITAGGAEASKFQQVSSLFATTYAQSYNDYYAEAVANNVKDPHDYAALHSTADAATMLMGNRIERFKEIFGGTTAAKILEKKTTEEIENIAKAGQNTFKNFGDAALKTAKATEKNAREMAFQNLAGQTVSTGVDKYMFNQDVSGRDDAMKTFVTTYLQALPLGVLGLPFQHYKVGNLQKKSLYEAASNPAKYFEHLDSEVNAGTRNPSDALQVKETINRAYEALKEMNPVKADGKLMTDNEKTDYIFNETVKREAEQHKEKAPEVLQPHMDKTAEEMAVKNAAIVSGIEIKPQEPTESTDKGKGVLEKAVKEGDLKGMQSMVGEMVLSKAEKDPGAIDQFYKDVADQALNKIAPDAVPEETDSYKQAVNDYGENVVKHAIELYPVENKKEEPVPASEPAPPLTQEANELLQSVKEGSKPAFVSKQLGKIAADNGIEITDKTTPDDIINALQLKQELIDKDISSQKTETDGKKTETKEAEVLNTGNKQGDTGETIVTKAETASPSLQDFTTHAIDFVKTSKASERGLNWILDIPGMSQKEREGAIEDIQSGKQTPKAARFEKAIADMHEKGVISIARGFGKFAESEDIPFKDYFSLPDDKREAAFNMQDHIAGIINEEGINENNIDDFKHLFNGFPYNEEDFNSVKSYLEGQNKGNEDAGQSGTGIEENKGEKINPTIKDGDTGIPPPIEPPAEPTTPQEQWTAIQKEKLKEVEAVKKLFDKPEHKKWTGIIESALNNLSAEHPGKTLYEAARTKVSEQAAMYDAQKVFNPSSEDLAVTEYFKAQTEKNIHDIQGWDSEDDIKRINAIAEYQKYNDDLVMAAKALNPSEAGRAFGFRQSEMRLDPEYGLQVRRMELMNAKDGEKLTGDELKWTNDQWEKERGLMQKEQELKEKGMKESFDRQIEQLQKDYQKKLQEAGKSKTKKSETETKKREDYLKNKGKEWADKIRRGKLGGAQSSFIPGATKLVNLALEGVAKLVEGGFTIAAAIDKYIADNKLGKEDEDKIRGHFENFVDRQIKRDDSLDKINQLAESNGVKSITTDMVGKNLIRDYVDSHIGEVEPGNILEHATGELEKVLPDLTKEKLTEAYLKTGEFKVPTKKQLQSEYDIDKKKVERIARIEKEISDLRTKKQVYNDRNNVSGERQADKDISAKEKELKKVAADAGVKYSGEDKYEKGSLKTRAQSHNDRVENLSNTIQEKIDKGDLTDDQKKSLTKLQTQLKASKIQFDENSKLSQKPIVEHGADVLKKIKSEFDRTVGLRDMSKIGDIKRGLQSITDQFNRDKETTEQDLKLKRAKDNLESTNRERQRKLNAGEYEDNPPPVQLTKSDAELVKLNIEKNKLESERRKKLNDEKDKGKSKARKVFEMVRGLYVAALIYRFGTLAKVGATAILRPSIEAGTKASFGQVFKYAMPEIYKAAKGGGESSSWRSIKESYTAFFRQIGEQKMAEIKDKANQEYNRSADAYEAQAKIVNAIQDKESKEYKDADKQLQGLKNTMNKNLLDATGTFVYDFIGSGNITDAIDALMHRSNRIEREFGYLDNETMKGGNVAQKINYLVGFIGRSHSALKTFSARANFAAGFMARMEHSIGNGEDVTQPDKILEIANESYLDWERGKYQQKNFVTDAFNKMTSALDKYDEGGKWSRLSHAAAEGLKLDVAITRVPVNIIHEAVAEYTVGAFRAFLGAANEIRKARNEVHINENILPGDAEFKQAVKNQLSKMDAKQAATIARCFRKGGFGLGLFALSAITGVVHFGGFYRKGHPAKKPEQMKEGELNPGEIMLGDKKLGDVLSKALEHIPAAFPTLFGLNYARVKSEDIEKGKGDVSSTMDGVMANLEAIQDAIPQTKIINPIGITEQVGKSAVRQLDKFWEWNDVDDKGNLIPRKPMDFHDEINLLINKRGDVLTETNYKLATSTLRQYNTAIGQLHKQEGDHKEEIEYLEKQRDEAIENIYEQNKQPKQ